MQSASGADLTGARLGRVVIAYLAMSVAVVTLSPFRFAVTPLNGLVFVWSPFDFVMNVAMFVPLGFVYRLSRPRHARSTWIGALVLGALLSGLVEVGQVFLPGRFPGLQDLVTNTAGAGLGAWVGEMTLRRTDAADAIRASAVELPLMGLVYLMAPLLWLVGLGSFGSSRAWTLLALAAAAGWIIGAVFTSFERAPLSRVLLATTLWLAVSLVPAALASPMLLAVSAAVGLGAAWLRTVAPAGVTHEPGSSGGPRRFEATTLRLALPLLALHLAVSSLTPGAPTGGDWSGTWALFAGDGDMSNESIFRALEHLAAFTLIGYAVAEYHGRSRDRLASIAPVVLGWATAATAVLELVRGWHPGYGASAVMFVLTVIAALLGAWTYVLQLAHVRAVTARPRPGV